jgi:RNA polymerase sigma-70 factor (ECF subfamily)
MNIIQDFCKNQQLKRTIAEHRGAMYRLAYSWCHNPALSDDLVQEALAKALKNSGQLRDHKTLKAWLFRILTNCWRDHFRRSKETVDIDDVVLMDTRTPEFSHDQEQIVSQVRNAISELPLGQRQVVTLVDLEGSSYIEVAEILEIPIGTVMSRLSRARQALKTKLLETDSETGTETSVLRIVK